ncbi:MAG: hypothetical protein ABS36_09445 [Acidobacteria bacterium SCN 69-37]|nr:MAG: hypothetical protein ABS36_09445 [Acidobacteria bacterium SCN 69-37]
MKARRTGSDLSRGRDTVLLADLPELTTVDEARAVLRARDRGTIYEMVRRGDLASVRVGRLVRIPRSALERLTRADVP